MKDPQESKVERLFEEALARPREEREASWERFINDPEWEEMSQDPYYVDTVSNITDFILEPTSYSQV